jgi:hypothetical protein
MPYSDLLAAPLTIRLIGTLPKVQETLGRPWSNPRKAPSHRFRFPQDRSIPDFNIEWPTTSSSETPIDWSALSGINDTPPRGDRSRISTRSGVVDLLLWRNG